MAILCSGATAVIPPAGDVIASAAQDQKDLKVCHREKRVGGRQRIIVFRKPTIMNESREDDAARRAADRYTNEPFAKNWFEFCLIVCALTCGLPVAFFINSFR